MTHSHKHSLHAITAFAVLFGAIVACVYMLAPKRATLPDTSGRPRVAATIFPVYDIARNVSGGAVDVTLVLPPGAEPHSFEPQPSTVREIAASGAVYAIGHGVDNWIDTAATSTGTPKVLVDNRIALRHAPTSVVALAGEAESDEGDADPHYWTIPRNGIIIAENIAEDMIARFPDRAAVIRAALDAYRARLTALDAEMRTDIARAPVKSIVTFHDAWYYFADEYGLTIAGTFEPAPGREPSPQGLATLRKTVRAAGVRTLFAEPLFSDAAISSFAKDEGLTISTLDDIGGLPGRDSYESLLRFNAKAIAQ